MLSLRHSGFGTDPLVVGVPTRQDTLDRDACETALPILAAMARSDRPSRRNSLICLDRRLLLGYLDQRTIIAHLPTTFVELLGFGVAAVVPPSEIFYSFYEDCVPCEDKRLLLDNHLSRVRNLTIWKLNCATPAKPRDLVNSCW